jgi:hypothetical protein
MTYHMWMGQQFFGWSGHQTAFDLSSLASILFLVYRHFLTSYIRFRGNSCQITFIGIWHTAFCNFLFIIYWNLEGIYHWTFISPKQEFVGIAIQLLFKEKPKVNYLCLSNMIIEFCQIRQQMPWKQSEYTQSLQCWVGMLSVGWNSTHIGTMVKIAKSISEYYKYPMLRLNQGLWVQI